MKASVFVNTLSNYIADQDIINVMEGLNDPFYGKFVKEDMDVSVSLWDVSTQMTGYGHWKITVKLEINGSELILTSTTTDSEAIDNIRDDDSKSEGYIILFGQCLNANEDEVYEMLDGLSN